MKDKIDFLKWFFYNKFVKKIHIHAFIRKKNNWKKFRDKMIFICVFTYHVKILSKSVCKQKSDTLWWSGPFKFRRVRRPLGMLGNKLWPKIKGGGSLGFASYFYCKITNIPSYWTLQNRRWCGHIFSMSGTAASCGLTVMMVFKKGFDTKQERYSC